MRTGRLESKMGFPAGEVFPSPEQLAWHVSHLPCGRFSGLGAPTSHCRSSSPSCDTGFCWGVTGLLFVPLNLGPCPGKRKLSSK